MWEGARRECKMTQGLEWEVEQAELLPKGARLWEQPAFEVLVTGLRKLNPVITRATSEQLYVLVLRSAQYWMKINPDTQDINSQIALSTLDRVLREYVRALKLPEEKGQYTGLPLKVRLHLFELFKANQAVPEYFDAFGGRPEKGISDPAIPSLAAYLHKRGGQNENGRLVGLPELLEPLGFSDGNTVRAIGQGKGPVARTYAQRRAAETTKP